MGDQSHFHPSLERREALLALSGATATAGLSGCLGVLGEEERDVSLEPANWLVPSQIDEAVVSGSADFDSIYDSISTMDGVTWESFTDWYGQQTPPLDDSTVYPAVPKDVIAGFEPFGIDDKEYAVHASKHIPAMAAVTIQIGDDEDTLKHLSVYELPDSVTKKELKEDMKETGTGFKQVDSVTVQKPMLFENENGETATVRYALEDGVLVNLVGTWNERDASRGPNEYLLEVVERAGSSANLGDHPVGQLAEMDMVHTYAFTDAMSVEATSKSIGIDFGNARKAELYTFEDQTAAAQSRDQFSVTEDGGFRLESEEQGFILRPTNVEYRSVTAEGRGVFIEADITNLPKVITEGSLIWQF